MAELHDHQKSNLSFEWFEGKDLHIFYFHFGLLCNIDRRLMFKQLDLYLPSNHREPTKEIHDMHV